MNMHPIGVDIEVVEHPPQLWAARKMTAGRQGGMWWI